MASRVADRSSTKPQVTGRFDAKIHGAGERIRTADRPLTRSMPPELSVRYPHGCHTKVPSLHPNPGDFQAIRSTTRPTGGGLSARIRTAATGWAGFHLSHPTTSSIPEPGVPAGGEQDRAVSFW